MESRIDLVVFGFPEALSQEDEGSSCRMRKLEDPRIFSFFIFYFLPFKIEGSSVHLGLDTGTGGEVAWSPFSRPLGKT
jgi:hypothetical protein